MKFDAEKIQSVMKNYANTNLFNYANKHGVTLYPEDLERLDELFEFVAPEGEFIVRSYEDLKDFSQETIMAFCVKFGIYCFPTLELVEFLKGYIFDKKVLEIGSGRGILSKEPGIKGVDTFEQQYKHRADAYEVIGQAPVTYGKHIERWDALDAVGRYKPDTVLAAWVTHQYDFKQHLNGGNPLGVKEEKIINKVKEYVFVGNDHVHKLKPILKLPHKTLKFEWLLSRGMERSDNSIYIWEGLK